MGRRLWSKKAEMRKFSIIVGTYNQVHYLPKLIESLENQTFKNFEVHFCDDGSDDGTQDFFGNAREYSYFKFPFQYHRQPHRGTRLARNLNQGIRAARGDYCVLIMADSFPELNYLENLNEWVNPDFIVCGVRVNIEGEKVVEMDYRLRKNLIPGQPALLVNSPFYLATGNGLCIPTEAMMKYGAWDEKIEGYGGEDNEIIARLYFKGYLVWSVPSLILYHNFHVSHDSGSSSSEYVSKKILEYERKY